MEIQKKEEEKKTWGFSGEGGEEGVEVVLLERAAWKQSLNDSLVFRVQFRHIQFPFTFQILIDSLAQP